MPQSLDEDILGPLVDDSLTQLCCDDKTPEPLLFGKRLPS